ncbi:MAG: UMP kinase [Deltaproteobacteria bacterium]|nr:MAG: UMP kinase [Deltaproteobacteria bacterium]TDJ21723.1 MAG: UMP kinase [Deltaproteobacteria bacterium]
MKAAYRRLLIKLSGERLAGEGGFGISPSVIADVARDLREVHELGTQVCVVIGGGNVIRGIDAAAQGLDRTSADYMGMLASVINALALQDALEKEALATRVLSAIEIQSVAEPYIRRRAERHLEKGRVVVFAAGTGNPYFSTDTAAALRAAELNCEIILMAKLGIDGVYDDDPRENSKAKRYDSLSFDEAIQKNLRVMDQTALALCRENGLPIVVFDSGVRGNLQKVASGEAIGTRVGE